MSELTEVFPIVAGVIIGVLVLRIRTSRMRTIALVGLSVLFGVLASFISGELFVSWDFLFVDIPLVFVVAAVTTLGVLWWQRRSARRDLPRDVR